MIQLWCLYENKKINITNLTTSIEWSGDKSQVARRLNIKLVYSINDSNQPKVNIAPGTLIWMKDESGKEFYRGVVFDKELGSAQEIILTIYDFLIYFLKSKVSYNFNNAYPKSITEKMCKEAGVQPGGIANPSVKVSYVAQGSSLYDIIMKAYTQASKQNKKQYIPKMVGTKLNVVEKGTSIVDLQVMPTTNLLSTSFKESIDGMINRVKIYNDKNNLIGQVENSAWVKKYGVLQEAYTKEEKVNATTAAKNLLHGLDTSTDIEVLGDINCVTGTAIKTIIPYVSALNNKTWYIDADSHTWEVGTGKYTMKLSLNYVNEMDKKE
jgi:hypothetical protein